LEIRHAILINPFCHFPKGFKFTNIETFELPHETRDLVMGYSRIALTLSYYIIRI